MEGYKLDVPRSTTSVWSQEDTGVFELRDDPELHSRMSRMYGREYLTIWRCGMAVSILCCGKGRTSCIRAVSESSNWAQRDKDA